MPLYQAPTVNPYDEWRLCGSEDFQPTPRQQVVIDAVQAAITAGMYYTRDVDAFCVKHLGVTGAYREAMNRDRGTEGGTFGMDLYYARDAIRAKDGWRNLQANHRALQPVVGQVLGTLVFSDYKRTTGVTVAAVDGYNLTFTGKRGAHRVNGVGNASQLRYAMDRAKAKGWRRDDFALFVGEAVPA